MKASIDIGSNTILLLVGKVSERKVQVVEERQYAPRLGKDVDAQKKLSDESMQRAIRILKRYKTVLEEKYPTIKKVSVIATSAVRDAENRSTFVDVIKQKTGFNIRVLSGVEEAKLTFLGANSVLNNISGPAGVIDIGGGSTEVAWGNAKEVKDHYSFNMGSVRFTERYLPGNPPSKSEIKKCKHEIRTVLTSRLFSFPENVTLLGVSGTATSMAAITLEHQTYQPEKLNGSIFEKQEVAAMIDRFANLSEEDMLEAHPQILKGRADVFLAGLLILREFMDVYSMPLLTVSTGGIRHGALLS